MKRWLRIYLVQVGMIPPSLTDYKLGNPVPKAQQDRGRGTLAGIIDVFQDMRGQVKIRTHI